MSPLSIVAILLTASIGLLVIIGPILVVVVLAFSPDDIVMFPPAGLSLRWFQEFLSIPTMQAALFLSVQLAFMAATSATVLATLAALHLIRSRGLIAHLLQMFYMAPLVFPTIILGLALLLFFRMLGVPVFVGLLLAHVTIAIPYAFRLVFAQFQALDTSLEEAGYSLGAHPVRVFFSIILPLIWPGVLSGWLFAFIVSLGELNTALFLTSPQVKTLPIELFGYLQFEGNQLVVAAASTVQIGMILVAMLLIESATRAARSKTFDARSN